MAASTSTVPSAWYWNRWCQLVLGLIAMMAISSPQYVWTLFTGVPSGMRLEFGMAYSRVT